MDLRGTCTKLTVTVCSIAATIIFGGTAQGVTLKPGPDGGTTSLSSAQLIEHADQAVDAARSVRLVGMVTQASASYQINTVVFADGDSAGTVMVKGEPARLIVVGTSYYFRGSSGFWHLAFGTSISQATVFAKEWLVVPRSGITGLGANLNLTRVRQMFDLAQTLSSTKLNVSMTNDEPAIGVQIASLGTIWLNTSNLRPTEFKGVVGGNMVTMQFTDWNLGSEPIAPKDAVFSGTVPGT